MEAVAWIGSILLALCGLPQAVKSWLDGRTDISLAMLAMWLIGEMLLTIYCVHLGNWPLLLNYLANILIVVAIAKFRLFPRPKRSSAQ